MKNFYFLILLLFKISLCSSQAFDVQNVKINGVSVGSSSINLPPNQNVTLYFEISYSTYALSNGTYYVGIRTPNSSKYDYGAYYSTLATGNVPSNISFGIIPVTITINSSNYTNGAIFGGYLQIYNYGFIYPSEKIISFQTQPNSEIVNNVIASDQTVTNYSEIPTLLIGSLPSGGNGSYTYQWQFYERTWKNITGATNKNYQPPVFNGLKSVRSNMDQYRRIVTSGNFLSYSNIVKITLRRDSTRDGSRSGSLMVGSKLETSEDINLKSSQDLEEKELIKGSLKIVSNSLNSTIEVSYQKGSGEKLSSGLLLAIYNLNGEELLTSTEFSDAIILSVEDFKPGIYILKLIDNNFIYNKKFVLN